MKLVLDMIGVGFTLAMIWFLLSVGYAAIVATLISRKMAKTACPEAFEPPKPAPAAAGAAAPAP